MLLAVLAGLVLGLSLGALGGGGSILAVPVLTYLLGETPLAATTGSLVVVGVAAALGAYAGRRAGTLRLRDGGVFALVGAAGAVPAAALSSRLDPDLLMGSFALLMLVVATLMMLRRRGGGPVREPHPARARVPRLLLAALVVGVLTGLLGVGGGFLVVPALMLALDLPMHEAVPTSLLVIAANSFVALAVRLGQGVSVEWPVVVLLTLVSLMGSYVGARVASRYDQRSLMSGFVTLLVVVALYTAVRSWPAILA